MILEYIIQLIMKMSSFYWNIGKSIIEEQSSNERAEEGAVLFRWIL